MSWLWNSVVNRDWCNKPVRNVKCLCWTTAVNNLPVGRCLLTHLPLSAGETPSVRRGNCSCAESMTVNMPNRGSRWDQEAAYQTTLIASFCSCVECDSSLTTFCEKGVCCLWVIWVCVIYLQIYLALRIEATPAPLPLVLNSILLCAINVGSGEKKPLFWVVKTALEAWDFICLFFFCFFLKALG